MKKHIIIMAAFLSVAGISLAQEATEATAAAPAENKPVRHTFENQVLINNQTVEVPNLHTLDFVIQHRFGLLENGEDDFWGLYAPSNIRLGLTYSFLDNLAVGLGATKSKHLYDLNWKYVLVRQTKPKGIPVTISYYGDVARASGDKENFLNQDNAYKAGNRFTWFHELMIARKVNSHLSLQAAGTYSYINMIDSTTGMKEHGNLGLSFLGRYQFSPQSSVIVDFDLPLTTYEVTTITEEDANRKVELTKNYPVYNFGIGYEVSTSSHQFQIFVCSNGSIISQEYRVYNQNDFFKGDLLIGFNITRQWGF